MTATRGHSSFVIGQHAVQCYEREERLADSLAAFVTEASVVAVSQLWFCC
jgi:hypothetical protein